ncbi:hypothetical protein D5086_021164 [Populus alba]|uniref:Uncharacterized protein n=1 Tax=Populus alba TaxID=43335 RepID=A0ACC4BBY9_POPAL
MPRKLTESKRFVCGRSVMRTSSRSIHAQEGSPEIQRQLNFGNRGIQVGMPRKLTESKHLPFAEGSSECRKTHRVKAFVCGRKCDRTSSRSIHAQEGSPEIQRQLNFGNRASKSECRKTHRVKALRLCGRKCDVEQVAEAYMLKRDHPKFKGQLNFRQPGHPSRNAANSPSQSVTRPLRKEV